MPLEMPRRRFLQVLTGIIAAPAVIKAEGLMKVAAAPDRVLYREIYLDAYGRSPGMDALPDILQLHTRLWFYPGSIRGWIPPDWREIVRLCDIDTTTTAGLLGPTPPDLFAILSRAITPTQAQTASAERDLPILRAASGRDIEPTA